MVEDLGGSNGTWWSEGEAFKQVKRHPLRSGELLRVGGLTLRFLEGGDLAEGLSAERAADELRGRLATGDSPGRAGWLVGELLRRGADVAPVRDAALEAHRAASSEVRAVAASILGALGQPAMTARSTEALLALSRDPEPRVRSFAIWAVATALADPGEVLLHALEDSDGGIFESSAQLLALAGLGTIPARWPSMPPRLEALAPRLSARRRGRIEEIAGFFRRAGPGGRSS